MKVNIYRLLLLMTILIVHTEEKNMFLGMLEKQYASFRAGFNRALHLFRNAPRREVRNRNMGRNTVIRESTDSNSIFQTPLADSVPFLCPTGPGSPGSRSATRPISVHQLRPGDIDVVGAMGDSLSAGTGASAANIVEILIENRGMSWSGGGESTWREYLTLPNILKEYNPDLIGFSLSDSLGFQRNSQFNVAEPLSISEDMPFQAQLFEKRLRSDSRVDFENDWKLVTIMIGSNDFCTFMCYFKNYTEMLDRHRLDITKTLDFLMEKIPRIIVNLTPPPLLREVQEFKGLPPNCFVSLHTECPCLFGNRWSHLKEYFTQLMIKFQEIDAEVAKSDKYSSKEDFAVVVQPFLTKSKFPERESKNGDMVTDLSYLSKDCFHFSQKCHAIAANGLWNNMMEPVGRKSKESGKLPFEKFLCPTQEHPFIFTSKNSEM